MIGAGVPESKVRLVRPCIEPLEQPDKERKRTIRRENGLPVSGPLVIFPGDYRFSKAAQTVAEAVPLLTREHPELTVVFACRIKGPGCLEERERIRGEIERAGLIDRVRFLETPTNMPQVIGTADAVLMPAESLYAKMDAPLVLLEAMAQAVPLILADVAPLNELLAFGAGIGIPPADPEALAEATGRLLENRSMREKVGQAGSRAIKEVFSAKTMTESVEAIYDEVLTK
jgi:glycosyltransferase involved in cell wall biosynthesis